MTDDALRAAAQAVAAPDDAPDPLTGETLRGAINAACDLTNPRLSEVEWDDVAAALSYMTGLASPATGPAPGSDEAVEAFGSAGTSRWRRRAEKIAAEYARLAPASEAQRSDIADGRTPGLGYGQESPGAAEGLNVERPTIVCLCGSTRFYDDFQQANYDLTMAGRIVLSVGFYPHAKAEHGHGEGVGHDSVEKIALDELHKRKIDLADRVYVLNRGGYIGASTRGEIEYAEAQGKPVTYAFDTDGVRSVIDGWPCSDHDEALAHVGHHTCARLAPDSAP